MAGPPSAVARPGRWYTLVEMRVDELYRRDEPCFSFEFFPPKTEPGEERLFQTLHELAPLGPGFVSVTYGAGGSTRAKTLDWTRRIHEEVGLEVMHHLTCLGHTRAELEAIVDRIVAAGLENILALRGDLPQGGNPHPEGLHHAVDLVRLVRERDPQVAVGVAGYPEGHLECRDRGEDIRHLKEKVDAGADFVITQLFFDNAFYYDFVDRCRTAGITVPIVPGLMPITNFEQIQRFTRMCGATLPMRLLLELERRRDDPEAIVQLGVAHATIQCVELLDRGAPGVHFYTLNKSKATRMIFAALTGRGTVPRAAEEA